VSFLKVKNYLDDNKKMQRRKRSCKDGTRRGILAILKSARGKGKQMNTGYNENYITDIIKKKSRKNGRSSRKQSRKKVVKRSQRRFSRFDDNEEEDEEDELEKAIMKAAASSTATATATAAAASTLAILKGDSAIFGETDTTKLENAIREEFRKRNLMKVGRVGKFGPDEAKQFLLDFDDSREKGYLTIPLIKESDIDTFNETKLNFNLTNRFITPAGTIDDKKTQLKEVEKEREIAAKKFSIITTLPAP